MDNYAYCTQFVIEAGKGRTEFRVLDYGCGAGQIVKRLRDHAIDAYGCEVFYEGGDSSALIPEGLLGQAIRAMPDGKIPFPDATFDLVLNNQVLEHVPDLESVVAEIHRVTKPSGIVLSMFPDRSVWREGHCGIPFLHWFPKRSGPRVYYAWLLRTAGLGFHKKDKTRMQWAAEFCEWLDNWTYYRPYEEIARTFGRYFRRMEHIEDRWIATRFARTAILPTAWRRIISRKWAGMVFVCSNRSLD